MSNLYELATEYHEAMVDVHEADGEIDDDLEARLDAIGGSLAAKVDAVTRLRANVLAEAAAFKTEAARLTERKRTAEAKAERLRAYLGACLRVMGEKVVKTPTHSIRLQATAGRVVLDVTPGELPECWRKHRDPEADLSALKASIKAKDPAVASLAHMESGESVVVR